MEYIVIATLCGGIGFFLGASLVLWHLNKCGIYYYRGCYMIEHKADGKTTISIKHPNN